MCEILEFPRPPFFTGRSIADNLKRQATRIEVTAMLAYREAVDQMIFTACEHGSHAMVKAMRQYLSEAYDIVSNEESRRLKIECGELVP